ncbi:MAG: 50S ribosomal protein L10 [Oligoflexia bacterium]|nr:50S ribosomal protein L10 [Oligoflexia bacterium]
MMSRSEKTVVIDELKQKINASSAMFLTNLVGISSNSAVRIRKDLRAVNAKIVVTKNTLFGKASEGTVGQELLAGLKGSNALVFVDGGEAPAVAKVIHQASKEFEAVVIKGGILDGKKLSVPDIEVLANLPSRDQMLGTLLATFNAPISAFARVLDQIAKKSGGGDTVEVAVTTAE